jgi:hypothetical protein
VTELLEAALANLLSPMVLFFMLGFAAVKLGSDLAIPEPISKAISLYLMLSIGFRGGVELHHSGLSGPVVPTLLCAAALSFSLPVLAYALLRSAAGLEGTTAAAVAAHYGSVSVVTFAAATGFLSQRGIHYEGYCVAMMALMESPAIITGLLLARRTDKSSSAGTAQLLREVLASGSIILLVGSFLIGWATGDAGMKSLGPVVDAPFRGVLAIFLLDMGLLTAHRLRTASRLGVRLLAFGIYMPLVGATAGLLVARMLGMSLGSATVLTVLTASASYIAVPAAMRLALPEANPAVYTTLSLGVTFPFNLSLGIPLYFAIAEQLFQP